jgi:hypothetical protein
MTVKTRISGLSCHTSLDWKCRNPPVSKAAITISAKYKKLSASAMKHPLRASAAGITEKHTKLRQGVFLINKT